MSFHIVCDSCTDLTEEDLKKGCYTLVPLTLLVDGEEICLIKCFIIYDLFSSYHQSQWNGFKTFIFLPFVQKFSTTIYDNLISQLYRPLFHYM